MSTFADMLDRVQDATLRGGSGNRTQIKAELNESIKQVDALLRPAISSSIETITANNGDYSIRTDFLITDLMDIRDVQYTPIGGGLLRTLRESTPVEIRELRQTTNTSNYIDLYALDGLDKFMIYPITQSVGDTITIYYVPRPADLVNDSDIPTGLPAEWHELYEYCCIPRSMRQTSPEETMRYMSMYDKKLGEYRKWRNRRAGARSRVVVVGSSRVRMPHDNSMDWRFR